MPAKTPRPFGSWPSPITPDLVARASRRLGSVQAVGSALYWSELRPEEAGRQAIVRASPHGLEEVLPREFSARSRVHEYGGGEFLAAGTAVYFINDADQEVYCLAPGRAPHRITDAPHWRFADFALDQRRERLIAIGEIHAPAKRGAPPRNVLCAIALGGGAQPPQTIATGRDFYASPRLSPDGEQLAFLAWDLPNMPWDNAALYVAKVGNDGKLGRPRRVAGGARSAAFQPQWSATGDLYYVADAGGWGALYRWRKGRSKRVLGGRGAELMRPQWVLGTRSFALNDKGLLACVWLKAGLPSLEICPLEALPGRSAGGRMAAGIVRLDDPVALGAGFAAVVATPWAAPAVMRLTRAGAARPIAPEAARAVAPGFLSTGAARDFAGKGGRRVFGFYYPPTNVRHRGPFGALPPALIFAHGGPTAMTDRGLKMRIQFFTSRGFAVFDVNYSGSSGYGRGYRRRLEGAWGIADVADCAAAARHLAACGLADKGRIAISGGSAGGYTVLMALATSNAFAAGSSHYGISDLKLLIEHTHKFESGYLHRLMGTTTHAWQEVFARRSPLHLIDAINAPVILFQGLDDRIVPPQQSRLMADRLAARGIDVEYHPFAGEGHGFRRSDTIIAVLEAELAFLRRVLALP
jgi:dipeptidyl aminopeptidase/acylaminoacyl peptidase